MTNEIKVVLIGVGGATCSGKTTLAKHLNRILPDSVIIHQDDFAPPMELVPIHPVHNVQDWDAAPGAIDWRRLVTTLKGIKTTGQLPHDHRSHDHLNEQKEFPVDREVEDRWVARMKDVQTQILKESNKKVVFGILDGFLLYWHPEVIAEIDVPLMLRVPQDALKQRRHERHGYHTAVQSDPEGSLWRDPPGYWEDIVWPAYVDAHKDLYVDGDIEAGQLSGEKVDDLVLLDTLQMSMTDAVTKSCEVIQDRVIRRI